MTNQDTIATLRRAARQEQFLDVVTRDEAERRFRAHLRLEPLGVETVSLAYARGRVLARDVLAPVDVPGFDRSSVDGFAVRAEDTIGATEQAPRALRLNPEMLTPGAQPVHPIRAGTATLIATGGMVPRGADAVIMVEHTDIRDADSPLLSRGRPNGGQHCPGGSAGGLTPDPAVGDIIVEIRRPAVPVSSSRRPAPTSPAARRCCAAATC